MVIPAYEECPLTGMSKYRVCMGVQTGICESGHKESCPLTRVSVKKASTVAYLTFN